MAPSATSTSASLAGEKDPEAWADCDELRTDFTLAMSAMYKAEVPLYGDLVSIVSQVNTATLNGTQGLDPRVLAMRSGDVSAARLDVERHGAIRLGTADELATVREVFALLGLHPVGYYDLSPAGLPMHATCFRPVTPAALRANPFRVFTSVLRPDLVPDGDGGTARALAGTLLDSRHSRLFSADLRHLLAAARKQGGRLTPAQGRLFVPEALRIFAWHATAAATADEYATLARAHPILADVAAFATPHINHLTPRTLDITAAQRAMRAAGMRVKAHIEGPPARACPVLLRQTSFLAVEESIAFADPASSSSSSDSSSSLPGRVQYPVQPPPATAPGGRDTTARGGSHRARFGEIEERGAAVTPAGRALYDDLMQRALTAAAATSDGTDGHDGALHAAFADYPDDWAELRRRRLVYFQYRCVGTNTTPPAPAPGADADPAPSKTTTTTVEDLVRAGAVEAVPITYEDFLPLSAAGIFRSNLAPMTMAAEGGAHVSTEGGRPDRAGLEAALGTPVLDAEDLYEAMERESIRECEKMLRVRIAEAEGVR